MGLNWDGMESLEEWKEWLYGTIRNRASKLVEFIYIEACLLVCDVREELLWM